jgi:hypothetical protein
MACLLLAASSASATHNAKPQSEAPKPPVRSQVPLLSEGLHLADFSNMAPRPELKDKLLQISKFIQNSPKDGQPATEQTEVWAGHTKGALYFVFICHDRHPELIRRHLARRENILNDDNVSVLLDPFQDHRTGVMFTVNAVGVQADAAWSESNGTDYSYDQVWDSEGRVTSSGWMALISIPFRSLRFRPDGSDWGVVFQRNFPRNSETDFWPRVSTNITGILTQEATLFGIQGVTGSHNIQINPYTIAQNERSLNTLNPLDPYFSDRHLEDTAGGEVKAILKDKIVFDATLNPDFSDIESDQPQFTVNQRYPVYFPELRPFFLENASFFSTPLNLIYTRNIVHPEYGIRVTGKIGPSNNIGLFAIDDRNPGETVSPSDPLYHQHAAIAVGRYFRNFGKGSSLGAIYTDYEFGSGFNRVGGIDFTARFNDKLSANGQIVESSTRGNQDSGTPPPYSAGPASNLWIGRSSHTANYNTSYLDFSKGFISQLGFYATNNIRSSSSYANHQWYPKSKLFQMVGVEFNPNIAFDHDGHRVYRYISYDPFIVLPRNFVIAPVGGQNSDTVSPLNYPALTHYQNFIENYAGLVFRGQPYTQFSFNLRAFRSGNVNYNPPANQAPFLLDQENIYLTFSVQPFRQLTTDNTFLLDRDHAAHGGELVYEVQTYRSKINYQFTRALSARVIVEYDSTLANPAQSSLQRTKQLGTEALFTWLPHPGTAVYVGYNNDLQNLDRSLCSTVTATACADNGVPRSTDFLNDGKQIFIKASYLFRF